jgi:hypothetical protein
VCRLELPLSRQIPVAYFGAVPYVADDRTWEKLWKAWRGSEEVPYVDFKEAIILVAVNGDPNSISAQPAIDDKGELTVSFNATLIAFVNFDTCAYQFALIRRAGIKTIGGKPIGKE